MRWLLLAMVALAAAMGFSALGGCARWEADGRVSPRFDDRYRGENQPRIAGRTCTWATKSRLLGDDTMIVCAGTRREGDSHRSYSCFMHDWAIFGSGGWRQVTGSGDCADAVLALVGSGDLPG